MGLPSFIRDRLNRANIESHSDLMAELSHLESMANKFKNRNNSLSFRTREGNQQKRQENSSQKSESDRKPSTICEKVGFPGRYHPETLCRNRSNEKNGDKSKNVRVTHNTELEDIINDEIIESKN